jgi:hypothetical protein
VALALASRFSRMLSFQIKDMEFTVSDKRFRVETLKIKDGGSKSKYYILVYWKLSLRSRR